MHYRIYKVLFFNYLPLASGLVPLTLRLDVNIQV